MPTSRFPPKTLHECCRPAGLLAVLLLFCGAGGLRAEEAEDPRLAPISHPAVEAEVIFGFGSPQTALAPAGLPLPVVIRAENRGDEAVEGHWEVEVLSQRQGGRLRREELHRLPGYISPGAIKLQHFAFDVSEYDILSTRLRGADGAVLFQDVCPNPAGFQGRSFVQGRPTELMVLVVAGGAQRRSFRLPTAEPDKRDAPGAAAGAEVDALASAPLFPPGARPVHHSHVEPWTLPVQAPPLCGFHAVVFATEPLAEPCSPAAMRAVVRYMLWGGTVTLPAHRPAVRAGFEAALPARLRGRLPGGEEGVGEIIEIPYDAGRVLLAPRDLFLDLPRREGLREELKRRLENGCEPTFPRYVRPADRRFRPTPNALHSFLQIGGLFVLYALLTGPVVVLALRRRSRRTVAWYLGGVIGLFCLLSVLFGPALMMRRGDARWLTVTELTDTGGVQWGLITVSSAGARRHDVEIRGAERRAWMLPAADTFADRRWRYYGPRALWSEWPQPRLAPDLPPGAAEPAKTLELAPWGRRFLLGQAHWAAGRRLAVVLAPDTDEGVRAQVRNTLPVALSSMGILLCERPVANDPYGPGSSPRRIQWIEQWWSTRLDRADLLQPLPPGAERAVALDAVHQRHLRSEGEPFSNFVHPVGRSLARGTAGASTGRNLAAPLVEGWVLAAVAESPAMELTGDVDASAGVHCLVQRLTAEELAPLLPFFAERREARRAALRRKLEAAKQEAADPAGESVHF